MSARISISALGPTISEQCTAQGVVATGMKIEHVDQISHALTLCHIRGMLTDSEVDRARNRLLKAAKLKMQEAAA